MKNPLPCFLAVALALAVALPATATASTTLGPTAPNPDPPMAQAINWPSGTMWFNTAAPAGVQLEAPFSGVVTGLSVYTDTVGPGVLLRVHTVAPGEGANFTPVVSSPPMPVTATAATGPASKNVLHTFSANLPVAAGQLVGFSIEKRADGSRFDLVTPIHRGLGWQHGCFGGCTNPTPPDGTSAEAQLRDDFWVAYNARIEPDADGDLRGDESQDNCVGMGNPSQADADRDGSGDACDRDPSPAVVTVPGPEARVPVAVPGPKKRKAKCPKGKRAKKGRCVKRTKPRG